MALIRALNDKLRIDHRGGQIVATVGVTSRGPYFVALALGLIRDFSAFSPANDPYDEHDFGSISLDNVTVFWKIDYYDQSLSAGADDPSDSAKCTRILTVMLADEY
ncbi:MAG: DUF3768 domain-containing protein [Pseudomonadota bacterium]|nr:DUF3768 domain-containing protein [Pseudomonadota bacterium]